MDKGSKLLLGLCKIWVCSPQFAYIYYIYFILYKAQFKRVPWVGLQYVNVAFPGLTQLLFAICLALLHSYCSFRISLNGNNDKHAIYIMI